MTQHHDLATLAAGLVAEFGDRAVAHCRSRRVELIAADRRCSARLWQRVADACEDLLRRRVWPGMEGAPPTAPLMRRAGQALSAAGAVNAPE